LGFIVANPLLVPNRFKKNYVYSEIERTRSLSQLVDDINVSFGIVTNRRSTQNKSANFNITLLDEGNLFLVDCTAGAVNAQLPSAAVVGEGFEIGIKRTDPFNAATTLNNWALFVPLGAETIDGFAGSWGSYFAGHTVWLRSDGVNWQIIAEAGGTVAFGGSSGFTLSAGAPGVQSVGGLIQTGAFNTLLNAVVTVAFGIPYININYRLIISPVQGTTLTLLTSVNWGNLTPTGFDAAASRVTNGGGGAVTNPVTQMMYIVNGRWK
jgi:hypothetical protein